MLAERPLAVVSGATRGIGREIAESLAAKGYNLLLLARSEKPLEEFSLELHQSFGGAYTYLAIDLADAAALADGRLADAIESAGPVSVLVNNAGAVEPGNWELASSSIDQMLQV